MKRLSVTLLGTLELKSATGGCVRLASRRSQALIAYLAARPGRAHSRDHLATILVDDVPRGRALGAVREALFALRLALPGACRQALVIEGETIMLDTAVDVDVVAFERLAAEATPSALTRAAALYRGDLLEGFAPATASFEEWLIAERARLRDRAVDVLARLLAHQSRAGAVDAAIQTATRLLVLDPVQEAVHRTLMRLYLRQGRPGAAVNQFRVCQEALQRELGVEPDADTTALHRSVLRRQPDEPGRVSSPAEGAPESGPKQDLPLIGRADEMKRLRGALADTSAGRAGTVLVVGEAGVGKTRLAEEFTAEARRDGALVLVGHAYETERILPFGPWVDALRRSRSVDEARRQLDPALEAEVGRLLPRRGVPSRPHRVAPERDLRLFEAVVELLRALAARSPVVLVLEDAHWADEMSLRLWAFVARRRGRFPVLLLATAREEDLPAAPFLRDVAMELDHARRLERLDLGPLSRAESDALVRALAGTEARDAVAQVAPRVWSSSEGNPFAAIEVMRALRDRRLGVGPDALVLPERVRVLVQARLERLGHSARALADVAGVIGRDFDLPLLQRAAGLEDLEASRAVEDLVSQRLLCARGDRLDFAHERIREAAREVLLPARRALLHRRVADAIAALHADDLVSHAAPLGLHSHEGERWTDAVRYLRLAGERALAVAAGNEAVALFERALAAVRRLPEGREATAHAVDLHVALRHALVQLGAIDRVGPHLEEAARLASGLGDPRRIAIVAAHLGHYHWIRGEYGGALGAAQEAVEAAGRAESPALQRAGELLLGVVSFCRGDFHGAVARLSAPIAEFEDELVREGFVLPGLHSVFYAIWLAWALIELGEVEEAERCANAALRRAEETGNPADLGYGCLGLGKVHLRIGRIEDAKRVLERGLALCRSRDVNVLVPPMAATLGLAYAASGRIDEGLTLLEGSVGQAAAMQLRAADAARVNRLAEGYLLAGRLDQAQAVASQALELARCREQRGMEAQAERLLGDVAMARPEPRLEEAAAHYRAANAIARSLGMRLLEAELERSLALVARSCAPR